MSTPDKLAQLAAALNIAGAPGAASTDPPDLAPLTALRAWLQPPPLSSLAAADIRPAAAAADIRPAAAVADIRPAAAGADIQLAAAAAAPHAGMKMWRAEAPCASMLVCDRGLQFVHARLVLTREAKTV